ncbi:multidrug effflux MFS transporter [Conyzicola nivalis]|nr:multidrug effflux MFS transporter [Conyzicola nivalis]
MTATARMRGDARRRLLFIVSLGALQAIWPLTMDLYLPSFPQLQDELGTTPALVQFTLTGAFIGMALGQLVAGPISDAVGRTRPLATALVIYAVATVWCALAPSIELLIAGRFAQGLGAAGCAVIGIALVRDTVSGPAMLRFIANLSVISGFFVVLSPALGAQLLTVVDWRGLFWVLAAYGSLLVVLAFAVFLRAETNPPERRALREGATVRDDYRVLLGSPVFRALVVGGGLMFAGMMTYMASSAFLFQDVFGLTPTEYAIAFGGHGALMIVGAQVSARLSRRFSPRRIVLIGMTSLVSAAALLLLSVLLVPQAGFLGFLLPLLLFTTSFGLIGPAVQAFALEPHALRAGTAASMLGASNMVFAAVASPIAGFFGVATPTATVVVMLVLEAAAFAAYAWAFRSRPVPNTGDFAGEGRPAA